MIKRTNDILQLIVSSKKRAIAEQKSKISLEDIERLAKDFPELPRKFFSSLKASYQKKDTAIIAEIKQASPSKGIISQNF